MPNGLDLKKHKRGIPIADRPPPSKGLAKLKPDGSSSILHNMRPMEYIQVAAEAAEASRCPLKDLLEFVSINDLTSLGYSPMQLHSAGVSIDQLKSAGMSDQQLIDHGVLIKDGTGPEAPLKAAPITTKTPPQFPPLPVQLNPPPSLNESMMGVLELQGLRAEQLLAERITAEELQEFAKLNQEQLGKLGFDTTKLTQVSVSNPEDQQTRRINFANKSMNSKIFTANELKAMGLNPSELKQAGFNFAQLVQAGFSAKELQQAGCSLIELRKLGYSPTALLRTTSSIKDLLEIGLSILQIGPRPEGITGGPTKDMILGKEGKFVQIERGALEQSNFVDLEHDQAVQNRSQKASGINPTGSH